MGTQSITKQIFTHFWSESPEKINRCVILSLHQQEAVFNYSPASLNSALMPPLHICLEETMTNIITVASISISCEREAI